ncbi:MAG: sigma-54-dependent Fis family transcriptional regulator [Gammaproteobacteria bacterium]|jgi:sigma-54 specific flagellar transcriptional regulator A|nr:sigma-54-dependent Fis family transcriptional regulator [Gammaproteobacteria bacterium]
MTAEQRLIGSSAVSRELLAYLEKISPTDAPVLVRGATGVGKELVAREIHRLSGREGRGQFIAVNCSAIPTELLESELFGHERGAFSGAVSSYQGRMRLADGGSLLLDEIGDMPADLQAKLLRAVQEGVVTPVGSGKEIAVDVRIISATHKPLEELIDQGQFREDLFFRLNVIPITVAPLRERPEEIVELFDYFSDAYALRGETIKLNARSISLLQAYRWPGNVRELENFCRRLSALYPGETINLYELPTDFLPPQMVKLMGTEVVESTGPAGDAFRDVQFEIFADFADDDADGLGRVLGITAAEAPTEIELTDASLKDRVSDFERQLIEKALADANGNISEAARLLGVKRTTLIEKMSRLSITKT